MNEEKVSTHVIHYDLDPDSERRNSIVLFMMHSRKTEQGFLQTFFILMILQRVRIQCCICNRVDLAHEVDTLAGELVRGAVDRS